MVEAQDNALYGEDLENYIRELREKAQAFFEQAGKEPIEIYRIEKFEPIKQASETHGKFYDGDSYVILNKKERERQYDIHFWHGKNCTADEMGSSAALSVQLADRLPMQSRQHLEEMEYETDLFMSYFKSGLFYLEGGIESGFRKVDDDVHEPRLLHIKGKRYPRVFSVPVTAESLNEGDCFVLDLGLELYCWFGADCNMFEKAKAGEIAQAIKQDDRKMKASLSFVREEPEANQVKFWEALGGKPATIKPAMPDDAPSGTEEERLQYKLFSVSDASGEVKTTEVTARPLKRDMMDDSDSYILELYDTVYIWQGKDSSANEKYAGMKIAKDFVKNNNKPKGTKISRVGQFCEDATFKSFFEGFYPQPAADFREGPNHGKGNANQDISAVAAQQVKAKELMLEKLGPLENAVKKVFHVGDDWKTMTEVTDPRENGKFFAESCYVVHLKSPTHEYFINWMGPKVLTENMAKMNTGMDALTNFELTNKMTRIRLRKGHEDETFLSFFPDGFAILDEARIPMDEWYAKTAASGVLFRVQAPYGEGVRAIEQNGRNSMYLNSGDAFTVITETEGFVWAGHGAQDVEKNGAEKLFDFFSLRPAAVSTVNEGEESEAFWASVGGQGEYSKIKESTDCPPDFEPRLFSVSTTSGYLWMQEVPAFGQEDLLNEDCYILDVYNTIYVWIGNLSNAAEQRGVMTRAEKFIQDVKDARNKDDVIISEVLAGREPPAFTVQFIQWEPEVAEKWLETDKQHMTEVAEEEKKAEDAQAVIDNNPFKGMLDPATNKFPYEMLKTSFPEGVPPTKKEYYLSDEEWDKIIGKSKEEWEALKQFQKDRTKKATGLF